MAAYREEYELKLDELQHITFTEYYTFREEDKMEILNFEKHIIQTKYFGFPMVQHNDRLVEFYTGLPSASQFYYVSSTLQRGIFRSYIKWDGDEKQGFLNHTMITLMKLRLNMTDEELAARFGIEQYIVNMTLRTWLPGLYVCVYKNCEDLYRVPPFSDEYTFTKVMGIVEVCFETPEYTRRHRNYKHEARKAILAIRHDGYVNYASSLVSVNRPDAVTITKSRFGDTCYHSDIVAAHPEHHMTIRNMGISCRPRMPYDAELTMKDAAERLADFRILMAIPTEYKHFHEYIFPACAALTNFQLAEEAEEDPEVEDE